MALGMVREVVLFSIPGRKGRYIGRCRCNTTFSMPMEFDRFGCLVLGSARGIQHSSRYPSVDVCMITRRTFAFHRHLLQQVQEMSDHGYQ
jgi:hypothetical protein